MSLTTRTTSTAKNTSGAITANDELLGALREMEQQNLRLPRKHSEVFAKAVERLLQVHRSGAQQTFGPNFGGARAIPSPGQAASANTSSSSYNTAPTSAGEISEPAGLDAGVVERDCVEDFRDVAR